MLRRYLVVGMVLLGLLGLSAWAQKIPVLPIVPFTPLVMQLQQPGYYLAGNLEEREATLQTRDGQLGARVFGSIGFQVSVQDKEALNIRLTRLNLVSEGVKTESGETGTIGLSLAESAVQIEYNARTGEISGEFESVLHYGLIDRLKGYRQQDCRGECDQFESYTETMFGKLSGRFREPLAPAEKGSVRFEGEISLELTRPVLGIIERFRLVIIVVVDWSLFQSAELLRIQPVFVGSGPSDPNATGTVFNTLMNYSRDMWNRCGTERCLGFVVNEPIYVNNSAYRVLDNDTEAVAFKNSIDVANAVEVFVAERMSTSLACAWGGGACFSGGTASAKVVSCDQQMAVPNPCPTACTSFCPCGACLSGAINPYHLAHELGHALDLPHPPGSSPPSTVNSIMEPSGFCCDNPNSQSAKNCRNAANPLLFTGLSICTGTPDIND